MKSKTDKLINSFAQILNNYSTLYSNIAQIDGKYNKSLEITSKVISLQFSQKSKCYSEVLHRIVRIDADYEDSSLEIVSLLLEKHKKNLKTKPFTKPKEAIEFAVSKAEINITILDKIIELIKENEKKRPELLDAFEGIRALEKADLKTLASFIKV